MGHGTLATPKFGKPAGAAFLALFGLESPSLPFPHPHPHPDLLRKPGVLGANSKIISLDGGIVL